MTKYRNDLPQLSGDIFLTDGGLETTLIFHDGLDLPDFAAFGLVQDEAGRAALQHYLQPYLALARKYDVGFILDSATWRANADWGTKLGYSAEGLADMNCQAIALLARYPSRQRNRTVAHGDQRLYWPARRWVCPERCHVC